MMCISLVSTVRFQKSETAMLSTHHLFSTSDRRFPATYGSDVAFERGCTEVSDENLYKCQTVEDSHGGKGLDCVANTLKKMIVRKQTKGNALHFCNCHGSACNKDWASAGGEDQPTQSPPDNTIK